MVQPIKITQVNRPLTCEEHDANIDALLDRANHTGLQNCNTIEPTSLNSCIASSDTVTNLDGDVSAIDARLTIVENAIAGGGSIETDLQNVRAELLNEIDLLEITLNNHDNRITVLEGRADGFDSSIISINQAIAFEVGQLQSQITGNDNDITLINSSLANLDSRVTSNTSDINTEISNRTSGDAVLTGNLNTEISNRIAGDNNLQTLLTSEASTRASADVTLQNNIDGEALLRQGADNALRADFEADDLALQAQITALQGQIAGVVPTGSIVAWAGVATPPGWLLCNGGTYSRTTYATLFSVIGTRYGSSNSSNFRVPNMSNRFIQGTPNMSEGNQGGNTGGDSSIRLTTSQLPPHRHSSSSASHTHTVNIDHHHGLTIRGHSHGGGGGGSHYHNLTYAETKLRERSDGGSGGGFPCVENSDGLAPDFGQGDWRTDSKTVGSAVSTGYEVIRPSTGGANRTDQVPSWAQTKTTSSASVGGSNTGSTGSGSAIDNRPNYIETKFIIKA